jgi:hypothetical protein
MKGINSAKMNTLHVFIVRNNAIHTRKQHEGLLWVEGILEEKWRNF